MRRVGVSGRFSGGRDGMILRYSNCGWNCNGVKRFHHAQLLDAEEDEWEEWLLCSTNTSHITANVHKDKLGVLPAG